MSELQHPDWHWPTFDHVLCGPMSDRQRLGLPDHYWADRYSISYSSIYDRLRFLEKEALVVLCESAGVALPERMVAGNLLAILGDSRISAFNPEMVRIAGGTIEVGLPNADIEVVLAKFSSLGLDEKWISKECPRHTTEIHTFAVGRYPVTNLEYRDFLLDSSYPDLPSSWSFRRFPLERANHPVYTISAKAADAYCRWLSGKTGRSFRLPTEAEWEYAAAGPLGLEFPWGNDFNADFANTAETGLFQSTPVGIFSEGDSFFGVSDMAGNVEEYVSDMYAPYPGGAFVSDHLVELHGTYRIARGGSFARFRDLARTRRRHGHNPRSATYAMGFRLAEVIN